MTVTEFKKSLSVLNKTIYFDHKDYLREKTTDSFLFEQYIIAAEELLKDCNDDNEKYFLMGTLGNLYRIYGEPQKAIDILEICISNAMIEGNVNREIVSLIRLGEVYKYNNDPQNALLIFEQAEELCKEGNSLYLDFVLQHKGKCLLEVDRIPEAKKCFNEALKLRKHKGDKELIESTLLALNFLEKWKN